MFLLDDGAVVYSATDLALAASCELALLRTLDAVLGRLPRVVEPPDAMRERAARLGDEHEERVLAGYRERFGPWDPTAGTGVVEIARPEAGRHTDRSTLEAKHAETVEALRTGADVVFQAGFFDGRFGGWADFLVRDRPAERAAADRTGPVYAVLDTKLARHAKITALLQVAAYADQMLAAGLRPAPLVHLVLGDRTTTDHRLVDLLPVYRERRARLQQVLDAHQRAAGPVAWGDPRFRACGRCAVCTPEVERRRDVLLVAGMRSTQRARLLTAGIGTLDELATSTGPVDGVGAAALASLRAQARLQAVQDPPAVGPTLGAPAGPVADAAADARGPAADPSARAGTATSGGVVFELFAPSVVAGLPEPDPGDIFFDFEGDPLWTEDGSSDWGLEYLFGLVEAPTSPGAEPVFRAFWAHDRTEEKQALREFLAYLGERRRRFPGMHVYHYASYERTALLRLAGRHGVGEDDVDQLLRDGVLVDLYATVRASLRTGQRSYSIKKLEPLYMETGRQGEVTTAGDSIVEYASACLLRDAGQDDAWRARLEQIAEYNAYDCLSTLRLRDWLRARAAEMAPEVAPVQGPPRTRGAEPASTDERAAGPDAPEHDAVVETLLAFADEDGPGARSPDRQAVAMLAASVGYHWREAKPFWWGHFDRLVSEPADWADRRSTFLVEEASVVVPWHVPAGKRTARRTLRLVGRLDPGSDLREGAAVCGLYDEPVPGCAQTTQDGRRGWTDTLTVTAVEADGEGPDARDVVLVEDSLRARHDPHDALPMALTPGYPPPTDGLAAAVRELARTVADGLPHLPDHPALDLLRRRPPRLRGGAPLPPVLGEPADYVAALTSAVRQLDGSYLAVQGPPGTGKTYTGARVVAALVAQGWRVGVVAQSHNVVENMLRALAAAGVDPDRLGKKAANGTAVGDEPWRVLKDAGFAAFYRDHRENGYVVGGTAWDFTNRQRLPDEPLDLLVVDEAGQFSLAGTVAVAGAARNLLLLGDPQQLPQVTQGRHPEPVDRSVLSWLAAGHDTLPTELGYFLEHSWRMHPALCAVVSRLAYEGRLRSVPRTAERSLEGVEPGVHCIRVPHTGNAVASTQEATEVVAQVRHVVGKRWRDPATRTDRPLLASDVLVVAAYNAQVWTVRRALEAAGLGGVRVGTVDRFQGQEAAVVVVTTAASTADDVPRGMEFLLNRNRVNVAISRGQWCAVVVRSPALTDHLPTRPDQLEELGAFIGVCAAGEDEPGRTPDSGTTPASGRTPVSDLAP